MPGRFERSVLAKQKPSSTSVHHQIKAYGQSKQNFRICRTREDKKANVQRSTVHRDSRTFEPTDLQDYHGFPAGILKK